MSRMRFIVFVFIAVAVITAGCARKHTFVAPGGKVSVEEKGGKTKTVEVQTGTGKATVQVDKKRITEAELGVPVYPGATVEVSGEYEGQGQSEMMHQNMLSTPDDFDKVFEFYKSHLKNVKNTMNQSTGDGMMAMFNLTAADGAEITVHLTTDKEKNLTRIHVMKMQKPK